MSQGAALVTGGSGFIGRRVVKLLSELGFEVVKLSLRATDRTGREGNICVADYWNEAAIAATLERVQPKLIFHLAGTTSLSTVNDIYALNTICGVNILNAASRLPNVPRVVVTGSAAEYGAITASLLPVVEVMPCHPISAYGISKLALTLHAMAAAPRQPVVAVRLFNVVGGGMPDHLALGAFAKRLAALPKTGGELQTGIIDVERDFVHVDDVARVLVSLATDGRGDGRILNICSGQPSNLRSFVQSLVAASGKRVVIKSSNDIVGNSVVHSFWGNADQLHACGLAVQAADPEVVGKEMWQAIDSGEG